MTNTFNSLISIENLFQAWEEFKIGKRNKKDVQIFARHLEDNLFELQQKLKNKSYKHGQYSEFYVNDPKRRHIHKAEVADRVVHHLLYKYLYYIFDKTFIYDSYSCRLRKGTHRAVKRLERFTRIVSKNYTKDCWALKLDIRQFFASIDHEILINLIEDKETDRNILWLIKEIIGSYSSNESEKSKLDSFHLVRTISKADNRQKGIPLGNLTSQIFANIYLNELDQVTKHKLKIKYYLRYADDFVIIDADRRNLNIYLNSINAFVQNNLKLELHPKKIIISKLKWGIDFCGYIVLPYYILPRTKTKKRIFKKTDKHKISNQSLQSYLGYLSHARSYDLKNQILNSYYLSSETF